MIVWRMGKMEWRMLKMVCEDEEDGMEIWPLDDIPDRKHQPGRRASAEARHHAYRKKTKTTKKKSILQCLARRKNALWVWCFLAKNAHFTDFAR